MTRHWPTLAHPIMARNTAYTNIGSTCSCAKKVHLVQNKEGKRLFLEVAKSYRYA